MLHMSPVEGPQQRQQSRGQAGRRPAQRTGKRGRENRGRQLISTEDIVLDLKPEKQPRQKKKSSDSRSDTPAKTGLREIQRRGDRRERAAATSAAPPGGANINGGPPGIIKPFPDSAASGPAPPPGPSPPTSQAPPPRQEVLSPGPAQSRGESRGGVGRSGGPANNNNKRANGKNKKSKNNKSSKNSEITKEVTFKSSVHTQTSDKCASCERLKHQVEELNRSLLETVLSVKTGGISIL